MRKLATFLTVFLSLLFVIFVVNQTSQLVQLATALHPAAGRAALFALLTIYAITILIPVTLAIRLPRALLAPADTASTEYVDFIQKTHARLTRNPLLKGIRLEPGASGIECAFKELDRKADEFIRRSASSLFLTTAISQNGNLDAMLVLVAQTRMIWNIARIYNQRPSVQEWFHIYSNVAATVFVANQIEDMDIAEQIEPVVTTAIGSSVMGLIPGASVAASIATQAVLTGTANAYLTLRVGLICQSYCKSLTPFDRKRARRFASISAAGMLATIVSESAAQVLKSIGNAARNAGAATVDSAGAKIRDLGARLNPFGA